MSRAIYSVEAINPTWLEEIRQCMAICQELVVCADFKTGSISEAAAYYLRTLCDQFKPKTVIEIGTYIGTSTRAMLCESAVQQVYTCDMHNDCLKDTPRLTCFPKHTSTAMLGTLRSKGVKAEFMFLDGRLSAADVPLILRCSMWNTVYAFDDYHENPPGEQFHYGKGVDNVALLRPFLSDHVLIDPPEKVGDLTSWTTIAVLVPKELL